MARPDHRSYLVVAAAALSACTMHNAHPEVYGHRGCGLFPENSIPAFLHAAELGVDFIELDVVISGDSQVVVSHEPWMRHTLCLRPDGTPITEAEERSLNLYRMSLEEIQAYDCGSIEQPAFPDREQRRVYKPGLREVVEAVDEHALLNGLVAPGYAIEIKSEPGLYGTHQPEPAAFVRLVLATIDSLGIADRCLVQSFDPAVLEAMHGERPDIELALLVENTDGWKENLKKLSFEPAVYSPHFSLVDAQAVEALHERGLDVVLWTVNEESEVRKVITLGIDGIVSDHPDRVIKLLDEGS